MRALKLELENFLPFYGHHTIDFSSFNAATISGPNEAGKSSLIIDGITFALYGKARKSPENLINDLSNYAEVCLTFNHQSHIYKAQRGIKRGKNQVLKLYCDNKDISERLLTNTDKKLQEILGFTCDFLLSTAVSEQDEVNKLSLLGPTDREQILNKMLGNEEWEKKKKKIGKILESNKEVSTILNEEKINLITEKELKKEEEEKLISFENELIPLKVELEFLEKKVKENESQREKYEENQRLVNEKVTYQARLKDINEQVSAIPKSEGIDSQLAKIKEKREANEALLLESAVYIDGVKATIKEVENEIVQIRQYMGLLPSIQILGEVPCKGLDIHDKCKLLKNALDNKNKIDLYLKNLDEQNLDSLLKIKLEVLSCGRKELEEVQEAKEIINQENSDLRVKANNLNALLAQIQAGGALLAKQYEIIHKIKDLESKINDELTNYNYNSHKELNRKRDEIKTKIHGIEVSQAVSKEVYQNILLSISNLEKEIAKYQKIEEKLANYKTLYTAYNEIPTLLFEEAIPTLEEYTNEILQKIAPERRVQLRSFKETKNGNQQKALDIISTTATGTRDFADLSGSAKFRQSLALRIALARYNREQNNVDIDMFVVDEGFGSLDEDNIFMMKTMLKSIASHFDLFLMVSHIPELKDVFGTQIIINPQGKEERIQVL